MPVIKTRTEQLYVLSHNRNWGRGWDSVKTGLNPQYVNTDRSKAVLLLWFLTVTCSCCPYLYFGSPIMWVTYLGSWMTTSLGKELFIDSSLRKAFAVNRMNSSFPNRWSFSYLKFTTYVTNIIAEPMYKYGQQEQVTVQNHNRSTALERSVLKYGGGVRVGGLNRFYGYPTSPFFFEFIYLVTIKFLFR